MTSRLLSVVLGVLVAVFAPAAVLNGCRADAARQEADDERARADVLVADTTALGASLRAAARSIETQNAAVAALVATGEAQRLRLADAEAKARAVRTAADGDVQRVLLEPVPDVGSECESAVAYLSARAPALSSDW